jgi:hypothetical protein
MDGSPERSKRKGEEKVDEVVLISVGGLVVKARPEGISVITDYERLVPWEVIISAKEELER